MSQTCTKLKLTIFYPIYRSSEAIVPAVEQIFFFYYLLEFLYPLEDNLREENVNL